MKLYNSLSKKIEEFKPIRKNRVLIYVCGITPYDTTHIGHAFLYVQFDALIRFLKFQGLSVKYVQNVTDIDDDILKRAKLENKSWQELGDFWTKKFLNDLVSLNVEMPTHFVKATDSIPKIIEIIQELIKSGFAYLSEKGNVYSERKRGASSAYFDIKKFPEYGKLSGLNEEQMKPLFAERGGNLADPNKKHPLDFILWQKSQNKEPFWESPFGKGRPGWHIECSAMVHQYLGAQIDIHGGGADLIYPHHESEIAQSESYTKKIPFSKFWVHAAMLKYQGEKMSKSLGNLVMVSNLLKKYSANSIRWVLLSHHYRRSWEFSYEELNEAEIIIKQIDSLIKSIGQSSKRLDQNATEKFKEVLDDDFNTPNAMKVLKRLLKEIRSEPDQKKVLIFKATLRSLLSNLGFKIT